MWLNSCQVLLLWNLSSCGNMIYIWHAAHLEENLFPGACHCHCNGYLLLLHYPPTSQLFLLYSLLPVPISNSFTLMWELVAFMRMPRQMSGRARNRFKHLVARGGVRNIFAEFHKSMKRCPKHEYKVQRYGWACLGHLLGQMKPGSVLNIQLALL